MRKTLFAAVPVLLLAIVLGRPFAARGADEEKKLPPPASGKPAPPGGEPAASGGEKRPALNPLEEKFVSALTGATLAGRWRLVKDGKLGQEADERYSISSVQKLAGDLWLIGARIQYGGKDVTLPVPVRVNWAGDTPVISVTKAAIPGLGTYTARVLVYEGSYAGTWSASDHQGFLSGLLERPAEKRVP